MEPVSCVALAGAITTVINNVMHQAVAIKALTDQIKNADAQLISLVAQLNSIKVALGQVRELVLTADYDDQLRMDLELALQASQLQMDFLDSKISKMKTKNAASSLKFRSKLRLVLEDDAMMACLGRLGHQTTALNLLITVMTNKSVTEQRTMLQRSNTRKVFKQIKEDNTSLLDETASMHVLRDQDSVRHSYARTRSEPLITKNPWKRFSFDTQVLGSKAYGGKVLRSKSSEKVTSSETVIEAGEESVEDAEPLVDDSRLQIPTATDGIIDEDMYDENYEGTPRFSKMLAFCDANDDISDLVKHARHLWNVADSKPVRQNSGDSSASSLRLKTRYFDLSIHSYTFDEYSSYGAKEDLLTSYKDVSSILFAAKLSVYDKYARRLDRDVELFRRALNDYNLWLAKIILFLDTTDLDQSSARWISGDVEQRFMHAGGAGASDGRIHVVVGEADEMAAGTIFAVCNESGKVRANKWAGLTKSPTF